MPDRPPIAGGDGEESAAVAAASLVVLRDYRLPREAAAGSTDGDTLLDEGGYADGGAGDDDEDEDNGEVYELEAGGDGGSGGEGEEGGGEYDEGDEDFEAEVAAPEDNQRVLDEEYRLDPDDGYAYTRSDFVAKYGGEDEWENAESIRESVFS